MLGTEIEYITGLSTSNTDNMAELEDILKYCQVGRDECSKSVMDEYTACDKISKEVIVWYSHNKKILKQMNDWALLYKDEFIEYKKKVNEVEKRIKNLKNSVLKS
jgi:hypothetical protein|tara:strand:+ start:2003 stop:2317 length:315 start_codon:yes stop_codon:yes gene_type:complete